MTRFVVGIDLGTTNTVAAFVDTEARAGAEPRVELFEIEQLVAPGQVAPRPLLPSFRYHPAPGELDAAQTTLPWPGPRDVEPPPVVGELARDLGARVPGRLVASAKSWLVHPDVDRAAAILPWGAPDDVAKVSPVAASASYLAHVRAAWDARHPQAPLAGQDVVLTVPASFDDAARQLTVRAAQDAGLPRVRLIEEPQAALYDWLSRHRHELAARLAGVRLVLVCDVGGGTSDFSLVRVELREGGPRLTRTAVGDHLVLGGDNMDLALARVVEKRWGGAALAAGPLGALIQECRAAKERLLRPGAPERTTVTLLGAGSRLVGASRSAELTRDEVESAVLDGFFPRSAPGEGPSRRAGAIREFGLPYVADPAVTRHLAAFLARHADASREALEAEPASDSGTVPVPDALLLNGGVFNSPRLAARLGDVLAGWRGAPLVELDNPHPDLAVARGAAAYGLARRGHGLRIGGGSARAYFAIVEGTRRGSREAVCLVPRGVEEGEEVTLPGRTFALRLGRPVRFHVASSTTSQYYRAGEIVPAGDASLVELPPLHVVVDAARGPAASPSSGAGAGAGDGGGDADGGRDVPVRLAGHLTEVGTLELHCVAADAPARRWALEFLVRGDGPAGRDDRPAGVVTELHPRLADARERVQRVFSRGGGEPAERERDARQLRRELEQVLGARDTWTTPLLRELFNVLLAGAKRRRRSADHERVFFSLAGWCLRPGYGYPLDDWRAREAAAWLEEGVQHGKQAQVWAEWWTFWRRVAGGLDEATQVRLWESLEPHFPGRGGKGTPAAAKSGPKASTLPEMIRLAAALERVPARRKAALGDALLASPSRTPLTWWAVGRLGARAPLHGSAHEVVPRTTAQAWLMAALEADWTAEDGVAFAATLLARRTGDRERDVDDALRARLLSRLGDARWPASWSRMVDQVVSLEETDQRLVFGESLPPGLRLID